MTLYCSRCVTHGVHENALEQVFIKDGTSWCMPHYVDHLETDQQIEQIRKDAWSTAYRSLTPYGRWKA